MYIAYSALRSSAGPEISAPGVRAETNAVNPDEAELQLRYHAYLDACSKHRSHIAEIQKYFPDWMPSPPMYRQSGT
jgi:hypothetical protein